MGFFLGGLNPDTSIEGIFANGKLTTRPGGLLGIDIGGDTSDSGMMPCDSRNSEKRLDYCIATKSRKPHPCLPRDLYLNTNDTYVLAVFAPGTSGARGFTDHVVEYCS